MLTNSCSLQDPVASVMMDSGMMGMPQQPPLASSDSASGFYSVLAPGHVGAHQRQLRIVPAGTKQDSVNAQVRLQAGSVYSIIVALMSYDLIPLPDIISSASTKPACRLLLIYPGNSACAWLIMQLQSG